MRAARQRRRPQHRRWVLGWAFLAAARLALADPAAEESRPCDAAHPQEAKAVADVLYEKGEYQRAGECYQAAGDASAAQLAFLKAVGPNSEANARALNDQQQAAKALLAKLHSALRSGDR